MRTRPAPAPAGRAALITHERFTGSRTTRKRLWKLFGPDSFIALD